MLTENGAKQYPGTGEYNKFYEDGVYKCAGCETPLYKSTTKFNSGCGWPAFYEGLPGAINRTRMLGWEISPLVGGMYLHIKCFAHTLNLIVRDGLLIMGNSVGSIRNAVRYVRSSGARLQQFKKCMEKEKVECKKVCILDVPTGWNSTYLMLSTALELRKAFDRLAREEGTKYRGYFEEDEELEFEEDLVLGLGDVNLTGDASKNILRCDNEDQCLNQTNIVKAFHDIVCIRAEIDGLFPQEGMSTGYKLRNFESTCKKWLKMEIDDIKKKSAELKDLLIQLCDAYNSMIVEASSKDMKVDRYLHDPIVKVVNPLDYDILEWWKTSGDKYPSLAALTKDSMAIQVSTVASESSFSTSRRVIDPFRSSLSPKTVEALICYQNWIRSESIHNLHTFQLLRTLSFMKLWRKNKQGKKDNANS
ncbi:unnamed protein product [Rhodiola kirilowii]